MNGQKAATAAVIQVLPYLILFIIILVLFKKFKNMLGFGVDPEVTKQQKSETDTIQVNAKKKSYSDSQYLGFANKLYSSMEGIGTDETGVKNVLNQMKTQDDWNYTIKVFGIRDGENLLSWLRNEFDTDSWFVTDYSNLNKILISKGIHENLI